MLATFRQTMKWLHIWFGVWLGYLMFFIFVMGTTGYFHFEIDRYMEPERPFVDTTTPISTQISQAQHWLTVNQAQSSYWSLYLPSSRDGNLRLFYQTVDGKRKKAILDSQTGDVITQLRATGGGDELYKMHYTLTAMPSSVAFWIVTFASMIMLLGLISGVVIHKQIFVDFFTLRLKKPFVGWLDFHNITSVIALPFQIMIVYTGLVFFSEFVCFPNFEQSLDDDSQSEYWSHAYPRYRADDGSAQPANVVALTLLQRKAEQLWQGQSVHHITVHNPLQSNGEVIVAKAQSELNTRGQDELKFEATSGALVTHTPVAYNGAAVVAQGMFELHEGHYANTSLRFIYFFSGLLGCLMIGSGMVLWESKRAKSSKAQPAGFGLIRALNPAMLIGLPTAITGYFIANRLLPIAIENRIMWEVVSLFAYWGVLILICVVNLKRNAISRYRDMALVATLSFVAAPLISQFTTDKGITQALLAQDWGYVTVDFMMLLFAAVFAWLFVKLRQLAAQDKKGMGKVAQDNVEQAESVGQISQQME